MERPRADRILDEWQAVSARARPPGLPVRPTGLRVSWAGPSLATGGVLLVLVAAVAGVWSMLRPAPTPGAAEGSTSPGPSAGLASWWVDPAALPPTADARAIPGYIRERSCANGASPEGRVLEPVIEYRAHAIVVTYRVTLAPGDCPSNPAYPVEVRLTEPLAGRLLLDGSEDPPRDATSGDPDGPGASAMRVAPLVASGSPVLPAALVPHCVAIGDWWSASPVVSVWTTRDRGCRTRSSSVWTPLDVSYDQRTGALGYRFDLIPEGGMSIELRLLAVDGRLVLREPDGRDVALSPIDTLDLPED